MALYFPSEEIGFMEYYNPFAEKNPDEYPSPSSPPTEP